MSFARQTRTVGQLSPIQVAVAINWLIVLLASGAHSKWLAATSNAALNFQQDPLANLLINQQERSNNAQQGPQMGVASSSGLWIPVDHQAQHTISQPQTHQDILSQQQQQQLNAAESMQNIRPGSVLKVARAAQKPNEISLERACEKAQAKLMAASSELTNAKQVITERQPPPMQPASKATRPLASQLSQNQTHESSDEEDDYEQDGDEEPSRPAKEQFAGNESVAHESSMPAPPEVEVEVDEAGRLAERSRSRSSAGAEEDEGPNSDDNSEGGGAETPPDELAARREQEAAEASEAAAADRSALADQQQAQREIILAQAQSEARAIRDQQEALLKQQQMQQQLLMQRHRNLLDDETKRERGGHKRAPSRHNQQRANERRRQDGPPVSQLHGQHHRRAPMRAQPSAGGLSRDQLAPIQEPSSHLQQRPFSPTDNQFSDQLENGIVDRGMESASSSAQRQQQQRRDNNFNQAHLIQQRQQKRPAMQQPGHGYRAQLELHSARLGQGAEPRDQLDADQLGADYSTRQPQLVQLASATPKPGGQPPASAPGARFNLTTGDLQAAAQHHYYGAHYGSLGGHHKGHGKYYQFAESHKKGQFDSGFKRGNKKFSISAHSSQHKGHAEGHIKWHGKKGKGTHYWDYKHKNNKHYGAGHGYGAGHQHHYY